MNGEQTHFTIAGKFAIDSQPLEICKIHHCQYAIVRSWKRALLVTTDRSHDTNLLGLEFANRIGEI